jgi:DNA segregation ATPase FtsK/SpoIIIE-like protein
MKIGYLYADQLIKELEKNGLLGPVRSDGTREVLIQESPATVEPRAGDFI